MGKPPRRILTSHPGQLRLLPSAGRQITTGQWAVILYGWGRQVWLISTGLPATV